MAVPNNADELVALIRKSGMVNETRLDNYLAQLLAKGDVPGDPRKLSGLMIRDGLLTYFQGEQFLLGKWRGFTIGKYKLLERIGFGGMGQVFLCEHMHMRRRVAIKVLPPAKADDPAAIGRFYREARAAGSLDHPNIVRTHDIDQDGNLHFLVMEYVDGNSLLEVVKRRGPLDPYRAANYIQQASCGLQHAFLAGVIHRDIKPGNLLLERTGVVKILDMGLARFYTDEDDPLTLKYDERSVLGTADYVAPEQTVNSHNVDTRADIYGMGATFYFILTGQPPFPDGTVAHKLLCHQTKEPTPIRELRPQVPELLVAVVNKMMAKTLAERFQTPAEVFDALTPFCQEQLDMPAVDEMPKLSPAALAEPTASGLPLAVLSGLRDGASVRPDLMQRLSKPISVPSMSLPDFQMPYSSTSQTSMPAPPPKPADVASQLAALGITDAGDSSTIKSPFADPPPGGSSNRNTAPPVPTHAPTAYDTRTQLQDPTPVAPGRPSVLPPPFSLEPLPPPRKSNGGLVAVVVVLFAALLGAGAVYYLHLMNQANSTTQPGK
jgi:serine/threonine protein kinase